ncbi:MAG: bacteriocin [Acidimicrobiia bacterium]|nr:MAG: bacteriocin [Acidimicrobiia bacterium]
MNHLLRELAPVPERAWSEIEDEATRTLKHFLTGRRVVDVAGPHGWAKEAVPKGRTDEVTEAPAGIRARIRTVQPLVEYRAELWLDRAELDAIERGAPDADLDPVRDAARRLALAEDGAVFHGNAAALVTGIATASPHAKLPIGDDYREYPGTVARAVAILQAAGVAGPYAVALGPRCYTGVVETTEMGGYPVLEHLRLIAGGPVLWAPAVDGAVVLSQRGGDMLLTLGQDVSIGYLGHDATSVHLYLEESFTFQVLTPEAAVHLAYA